MVWIRSRAVAYKGSSWSLQWLEIEQLEGSVVVACPAMRCVPFIAALDLVPAMIEDRSIWS